MPICEIDTRTIPRATEAEWELGKASAMRALEPPTSVRANDPRETPVPNRNQLRMARAGISHLSAIIADANELLQTPFTDEDGDQISTTPEAHQFCYDILINAAIIDAMKREAEKPANVADCVAIPAAVVSSDERGGIRVEWVRDEANVHLVIPAVKTSESYIYIERGGQYKTIPATAPALAQALRDID